jgi:hypothetical protein
MKCPFCARRPVYLGDGIPPFKMKCAYCGGTGELNEGQARVYAHYARMKEACTQTELFHGEEATTVQP